MDRGSIPRGSTRVFASRAVGSPLVEEDADEVRDDVAECDDEDQQERARTDRRVAVSRIHSFSRSDPGREGSGNGCD